MYTRVNEPQSVGGVLDSGFRLFTAGFKRILPVTYVAALVGGIWGLVVQSLMLNSVDASGEMQINFVTFGLAYLLVIIIVSIVFATVIAMIHAVFMGEDPGFGQVLAVGARRGLPLAGATLLFGLVVGVGFLLLVIPGIYLSVALAFAFYAVVVEKKGALQSLKYSRSLVTGNWWRTAGLLSIIFIIAMVFYVGIGFVAAIFVSAEDSAAAYLEFNLLRDIIIIPVLTSVISAILYCLGYVVYYDLKMRREGLDMAERIEDLGQS